MSLGAPKAGDKDTKDEFIPTKKYREEHTTAKSLDISGLVSDCLILNTKGDAYYVYIPDNILEHPDVSSFVIFIAKEIVQKFPIPEEVKTIEEMTTLVRSRVSPKSLSKIDIRFPGSFDSAVKFHCMNKRLNGVSVRLLI